MNETKQKIPATLDEIIQLRKSKLEEIKTQKQVLSDSAKDIFAPFKPFASRGYNIIHSINAGMAIFDGIILGFKVMKKIRSLFKSNRKA